MTSLGSKANVADGGIRKGTRSDEIRPIIRRWPLPPLRPKPAASGVAGLRSGSGQRRTNHALMTEALASEPHPELFHLIYRYDIFERISTVRRVQSSSHWRTADGGAWGTVSGDHFRIADNPRSRDSGVVLTGPLIPRYTPTHSGQTLRARCTVRKRVPPMYSASSKEGGIEP